MLDRSSALPLAARRSVADAGEAGFLRGVTPDDEVDGTCVIFVVAWVGAFIKTHVWVAEEPDAHTATSALSRDELVHALATSLSATPGS
jgi:hypothetical protein